MATKIISTFTRLVFPVPLAPNRKRLCDVETFSISKRPDLVLYIDLLNLELEARYQLEPERLYKELAELPGTVETVVIDEVQKVPRLLDVVHRKIEESNLRFVLTGSSARKLKAGGANLLAGRAVVFPLYPLLAGELTSNFDLADALAYGTLPRLLSLSDSREKRLFLTAYANAYLKEEVWGERKIEPFRRFLQVAAQLHGQPVNYSLNTASSLSSLS